MPHPKATRRSGPCEHAFVSIKGCSYANFQRALKGGNLTMIRAAATELPAINLEDALTIAILVSEQRPEQLERAALRWLGRYALERKDATLAGLREAAGRIRPVRYGSRGGAGDA